MSAPKYKEFKPTSWAIDNKISIFILTIIITLAGISVYNSIPKEQFPEIVIPTIYVSTVYPGTSPADMENLVTKPLEKEIKAISGIKKLTSNSLQDFSNVVVEFGTEVNVAEAKQKVKDAVDKARSELPTDLPQEPTVLEIDLSEIPIMYINISGNFDLSRLKQYADNIKDRIEGIKSINRVDLVGALDREIQVDVDMYRMQAAKITMDDVERAIKYENMTISGGNVNTGPMKRAIRVVGEFSKVAEIENIIVTAMTGTPVFLKDIATITDGFKEKESYARLNGENVITLNVIKRSGENLIATADEIRALIDEEKAKLPGDLKVTITGDQSTFTRTTVHDLVNTIIIGFILVTLVLMFFMGTTNAMFVGLSVPLSSFLAFMFMPSIDFTLNMIVLFSLLMALGVVVDDAIVVIENTHRIFANGRKKITDAAKEAAGEVFLPVLAGTLTTVAPFLPLAFWGGVVGKFMFFLPITLILTLMASLLVAYIINPVFAAQFMKPEFKAEDDIAKKTKKRSLQIASIGFVSLAVMMYLTGNAGLGNFLVFVAGLLWLNRYVLSPLILNFQEKRWPVVQNAYERLLRWAFVGRRPSYILISMVGLFFATLVITIMAASSGRLKVDFFPQGDPNFVYTYISLPVGTDQKVTDSITLIVEEKVAKIIGKDNPIVESLIANVAVGAGDPMAGDRAASPNKGKVTVAFVEFAKRNGESTQPYLDKIREAVKGLPGVEITVDKEQNGPPTGKPINIEISGDDFAVLGEVSNNLKRYLDSVQIAGVEELKSDLELSKPEILISIDRERAQREGLSTAQIGAEIRAAVFGKEVSKFRDANDEIPIQLRYAIDQRTDVEQLINTRITYRDMNAGGAIRQIPLSSVAKIEYTNSYGSIKRKNQKRVVTLSSNVLTGFTANEVVFNINKAIQDFDAPEGYTIAMTGEQEEQAETGAFLSNAMLISIGLIFMILVLQFNSVNKSLIILSEIVFSIIGVLLGFVITGMSISVVMTGIGVVALAGIVVKNGILIVEYIDVMLEKPGTSLKEAIIQAGKIRMTPVILTALSTILGLIPLAVGLNIDFTTLFTELNPHIFFGGDSVAFFGPLSWTIIFGLAFATFLTLVVVPVMYYITYRNIIRRKYIMRKLKRLAFR
jgi:multidrug efflux pump subunit AcrB